ncbi:MAG: hypothetical protein ACAI38_14675 [Myxococcota bacterium]
MKLASLSAIALFAIAACSSSDSAGDKCKDNCRATCEGEEAPTAAELVNCDNECDAIQTRTEKQACEDELAALFDCAEENQCKATFAADCNEQSEELEACTLAYCRAHTSDPDC